MQGNEIKRKDEDANGGDAIVAQPVTAVLKSKLITGTSNSYMNGCVIGMHFLSHSLLCSQAKRSLRRRLLHLLQRKLQALWMLERKNR